MSIKQTLKKVYRRLFHHNGKTKVNITAKLSPIEHGNILAGKKVLITGGGRGLGKVMAKKCVKEGATVVISGRNQEHLRKTVAELGEERCSYIVFDVTNVDAMDEFVIEANSRVDGLNCLICNAGISLHEKNILEVSQEQFDQQINTNLKSVYFLVQAFLKQRNKDVPASIILMSSERGKQCDDVSYGLIKAAINSLTQGLSRRFYREGVRVNAIAPGVTASDMTGRPSEGNIYCEGLISRRWFLPEEVAEVAAFLLSDASNCISGEIIACDAGQYISSYFN